LTLRKEFVGLAAVALVSGCAHPTRVVVATEPSPKLLRDLPAAVPATAEATSDDDEMACEVPAIPTPVTVAQDAVADAVDAEADDDEEGAGEDVSDLERESRAPPPAGTPTGPLYTGELSDEQLTTQWTNAKEKLGSISVGFADEGRLINGQRFPDGDGYTVVTPDKTWGTSETIAYVQTAIRRVRELHPDAPILRVDQISGPEGGYLRPHHSHQNGRDADLGFYYPTADPVRVREREKYINPALNWELIKALVTLTDVEFILVDRRIQKVLYNYALRSGEDPAWLDSLFHAGANSLLHHARRHRDHFHVRFYNPRAQELGRRIAPLLALRPEENRLMHRVHAGDTLGALALRYGTTVAAIQKVNHLKGSFLHIAQVLQIPLRRPCTQCPVPAPVVVPPRRLCPVTAMAPQAKADGSSEAIATAATQPPPNP
jgi:murein endopeptidase/LysM repeat protein